MSLRGEGVARRESGGEGRWRRGNERRICCVNSYFRASQKKKKKIKKSPSGNNFLFLENTDQEPVGYNKQDPVSVTETEICGARFLI